MIICKYTSPKEIIFFCGCFLFCATYSRGFICIQDLQGRYHIANQIWYNRTIHPSPIYVTANPEVFLNTGNNSFISISGLGQSVTILPSVILADLVCIFLSDRNASLHYKAGQFIHMVLILPVLATISLYGFYRLCLVLGINHRQSIWTIFSLGFATYWVFYTKAGLMGMEVTGWFAWALVIYNSHIKNKIKFTLTGLLLGITFHYRQEFLIPVVLTLMIIFYNQLNDAKGNFKYEIFLLVLPIFFLGCLVLLHNYVRTGNIFSAGAEIQIDNSYSQFWTDYPGENTLALFFGGYKGLFWYNPILFLIFLIPLFPKKPICKRVLYQALIPISFYIIFVGSVFFSIYEGGWGPRYLFPVVPFLIIGISYMATPNLNIATIRYLLIALVLLSFIFQLLVCFDDHHTVKVQTQLVNGRIERLENDRNVEKLTGWRASMLAGRLRNLGIPLGDSPVVTKIWNSSQVQSVRFNYSDNVWWLKLGTMVNNQFYKNGLAITGLLLTVISGVLILFGLFGSNTFRFTIGNKAVS